MATLSKRFTRRSRESAIRFVAVAPAVVSLIRLPSVVGSIRRDANMTSVNKAGLQSSSSWGDGRRDDSGRGNDALDDDVGSDVGDGDEIAGGGGRGRSRWDSYMTINIVTTHGYHIPVHMYWLKVLFYSGLYDD